MMTEQRHVMDSMGVCLEVLPGRVGLGRSTWVWGEASWCCVPSCQTLGLVGDWHSSCPFGVMGTAPGAFGVRHGRVLTLVAPILDGSPLTLIPWTRLHSVPGVSTSNETPEPGTHDTWEVLTHSLCCTQKLMLHRVVTKEFK